MVNLHVGYVGITRGGKRVEITGYSEAYAGYKYPWLSDAENYTESGTLVLGDKHNLDIVGPWVEPVDYNDGKWHRWSGGDIPVHPKSVVAVTFLSHKGTPRTECRAAKMFDWELTCVSPVVAFCVTKEYIEPVAPVPLREFWLYKETMKAHYYNTKPTDVTNYIHVIEVKD